MLHAIRSRENWRKLATHSTLRLFNKFGVEKRVRDLFSEVLVTEDGELSTGRDFGVYGSGMDASAKQKYDDIFPYVLSGLIGDMGCGTGILMWSTSRSAFRVRRLSASTSHANFSA